jgi:hypothetical protein
MTTAAAGKTPAVAKPPETLPVRQAALLPQQATAEAWLIESIWSHLAVGFVGGHPKSGKSWLALDLAVSVASGTACLGAFKVRLRGPSLVYLAEDPLPRVRDRIAGLCAQRNLALDALDLHVITAPRLLLDDQEHRSALQEVIARLKPRLLVLDPLVRLHSMDENSSADISRLLGFLRGLSRKYDLAIVVVHHMSKKARNQLGQALRGSSDLHAWSDSSAFLTRQRGQILLTLEHRSAPAPEPIPLVLAVGPDGATPHLERAEVTPRNEPRPLPLADQLCALLAAAATPLSRVTLRDKLRVNNARLGEALLSLESARRVARASGGWTLVAAPAPPTPTPRPPAPRPTPAVQLALPATP